MKRKIGLFLFAMSVGLSAAHATDYRVCANIYNACQLDEDLCYEQYIACLMS